MRYFKIEEFECKCGCGKNHMSAELLKMIDNLRILCGFPLIVTSGTRCLKHNTNEGGHPNSGHMKGLCVDISAYGDRAAIIISHAYAIGFTGIGISQKGPSRFIHLDIAHEHFTLWSY